MILQTYLCWLACNVKPEWCRLPNAKLVYVIDNGIKQMFWQEQEQHVASPRTPFSNKYLHSEAFLQTHSGNKFLKADQINHKGIRVYTVNATDDTSTDRHVDVIASFYTTMEQACSVDIYSNKTWNAHKIIGSRTFQGQEQLARSLISNSIFMEQSVTSADTGQCLTDRVTIRSSINDVLWSQMRIMVTNPFRPCTYSDISKACLLYPEVRGSVSLVNETNFSEELSPSTYRKDGFLRNTGITALRPRIQ